MSEQPIETPETTPVSTSRSVSWKVAAILAVVALISGVWLGRVAFFSFDEPSPRIVEITVEDEDLTIGGHVEYIEDKEIYILTINTMPPPEEGEVFQVWVQRDELIVGVGELNPTSRTFAFASYSGRYEKLFVTAEPGPFGSESPTTEELISADLTQLEDEDD